MEIDLRQEQTQRLTQRMQVCMQLSSFLDCQGEEFWQVVRDVENSDIFRKLRGSGVKKKAVRILPLKKYIPLREGGYSSDSADVESILMDSGDFLKAARDLGEERFRYYFLEGNGTAAEIADLMGIDEEQVRRFKREVIDSVQMSDAISGPVQVKPGPERRCSEVVAALHLLDKGIQIEYEREKSRYRFNDEVLDELIKEKKLSQKEIGEVKKLRRKMEWINLRFDLLSRIIKLAVDFQEPWIRSGRDKDLKVFEARKAAELLKVDPSWISRLIRDKYLKLNKGWIKLRDLFITERELQKKKAKTLLRRLIEREERSRKEGSGRRRRSDEWFRRALQNEFNYKTSRRSINNWRREIEEERHKNGR